MSNKLKTLYDDVLKLRNRLSNDGSGEVFFTAFFIWGGAFLANF